MAPLISHIIGLQGGRNLKVFTKPEYRRVFESLGFHLLAEAPKAILLENGGGLEAYVRYLAALPRKGVCGVVVMNANPFTLGHRHLLEVALKQVDTLFVLPVKEDVSFFPYAERRSMLEAVPGVVLAEGSAYQISAATFPTYFLKDLSEASETQMQLDIDLFARQIAPALGASVRFVGEEPEDALTSRYNSLMAQMLPSFGISTVVVPRLRLDGVVVSASRVRRALLEGHFAEAACLTPGSVHPYLLSALAVRALRMELDTPLKPGLVGPDSSGAHHDMDYGLMQRGIAAIRPYLSRMACAETAEQLVDLGLAAEKEMLSATLGVNTHRGAIFCLGIALAAAGGREMETIHSEDVMQNNVRQIAEVVLRKQFSDSKLHFTLEDLHGARAMAAEAYAPLLSRLAEDGIDCFLLEMPFSLAILDTNAADKVLDKYDYGCVMVSGHSMGGVAASNYAAEHGNVDGLVLLASYPSKEIGGSVSVLSIYGSRDGVLDSGAYSSAKSKLPDNSAELVIEGGNHAQFGNYGKQFGDNDADISAEEQQRQTAEAILALKIRIA